MKLKKNRKLKGSVLLTVVSVMALLIIFMASTVTLATAANNRAHANYSDSQAEYTARAAIESFTQALSENDAVAQAVKSMQKDKAFYPKAIVKDSGMGSVGYYDGDTWVKDRIKVEYIKDNMSYDPDEKVWKPMQVIKITATGRVGKQEKSVSYYIERTSVETTSTSIKGFQTLAGGGLQNNGDVTGALTMGLESVDSSSEFGYNNDYKLYTDTVFINGNFSKTNGSFTTFNVNKAKTQYVINGDFTLRGSTFDVEVDYPYAENTGSGWKEYRMTQQNIPYLYIKGNLGSATGSTVFSVKNQTADTAQQKKAFAPFNVFAGSIGATTTRTISGSTGTNADQGSWGGVQLKGADLYLMNSLDDPELIHDSYLSGSSGSDLFKWSSSVVNGTSNKFYSEGGSVYCNHNLHIDKATTIQGDLVVEGDLYVNAALTVTGKLVVKETIHENATISAGSTYNGNGGGGAMWKVQNQPADALKANVVKVKNLDFEDAKKVPSKQVDNIPKTSNIKVIDHKLKDGEEEKYADFVQLKVKQDGGNIVDYETGVKIEVGYPSNMSWSAADNANVGYIFVRYKVEKDEDGNEVKTNEIAEALNSIDYIYIDALGAETTEPSAVYYVDAEGNPTSKATDQSGLDDLFYVADKDGNATTAETAEPFTLYRCDYDGNVTDEVTTDYFTYYLADGVIADDGFEYYDKADPDGKSTGVATTDEYTYYEEDTSDGTFTEIDEADAIDPSGSGMYYAWYDHSPSPAKVPDEFYYYDAEPTGSEDASWHNAHKTTPTSVGSKHPLVSYSGYHNGSVYPEEMLDANLTSGDSKVVMTIDEARSNIGMLPSRKFPDGLYDPGFDSSTAGLKKYKAPGAGKTLYIASNGILEGSYDQCKIEVVPKDATDTINLVIKNCTFSNGAAIVVANKGTVNIMFEGASTFDGSGNVLGFSTGAGIYTQKIVDSAKSGGTATIHETDKMNIVMFGKEGSKITNKNTGLFCGTAKCPFTEFINPATQGCPIVMTYVTKTGEIVTKRSDNSDLKANWIGSALFKKGETNDNFFLLYTESVDDGNKGINNSGVEGANWYPKFYDAY